MASKALKRKIVPIDPLKSGKVADLIASLATCSFQGRSMAYALDVWEAMVKDRDCFRVMSLAGAMVPAGMGLIIIRLIEARLIDAIICTGATLSHDLCNTVDRDEQAHFLGDEYADDEVLRDESINRIYDTYLPESAFQSAEHKLLGLYGKLKTDGEAGKIRNVTTESFCRQIGMLLPGRSILTAAARHGVALFVPAISDSELGLNVVTAGVGGKIPGGGRIEFSTLRDVETFASMVVAKKKAGLVSIGGGVPRNWAQQVYPYLNMKVHDKRVKADGYHYGVRITTDRPEFGGLSGCTISESKSWGKYENQAVEASVICDATIALPLLSTGLFQRLASGKGKRTTRRA